MLLEKKNLSAKSYIINNKNFTNFKYNLSKKNYPKKIAIVICFYFNKNKINILKKTVKSITTLFNFELTLLTNQLSKKQKNILLKVIRSKKRTIKIYEATKLPDNNLLPWYSINVMKERFKNKSFSHFMFIEDDIIISSKNICYWIYYRKILKKFNLVPGFLRYENYKKDLYAVDYQKRLSFYKNSI